MKKGPKIPLISRPPHNTDQYREVNGKSLYNTTRYNTNYAITGLFCGSESFMKQFY